MICLYCGGAFGFDYLENNYYEKASKDYRAILLGGADKLLQKSSCEILRDNVLYTGPFYFESDGMVDKDIVKEEVKMIKKCTNAVFLLDSGCCPGTIAELILATKLGKDISVFYIKKNDNEETESTLHTPCWFPIIMSQLLSDKVNVVCCDDYLDAVNKINCHIDSLDKKYKKYMKERKKYWDYL